jgi:hypothetical protein
VCSGLKEESQYCMAKVNRRGKATIPWLGWNMQLRCSIPTLQGGTCCRGCSILTVLAEYAAAVQHTYSVYVANQLHDRKTRGPQLVHACTLMPVDPSNNNSMWQNNHPQHAAALEHVCAATGTLTARHVLLEASGPQCSQPTIRTSRQRMFQRMEGMHVLIALFVTSPKAIVSSEEPVPGTTCSNAVSQNLGLEDIGSEAKKTHAHAVQQNPVKARWYPRKRKARCYDSCKAVHGHQCSSNPNFSTDVTYSSAGAAVWACTAPAAQACGRSHKRQIRTSLMCKAGPAVRG